MDDHKYTTWCHYPNPKFYIYVTHTGKNVSEWANFQKQVILFSYSSLKYLQNDIWLNLTKKLLSYNRLKAIESADLI